MNSFDTSGLGAQPSGLPIWLAPYKPTPVDLDPPKNPAGATECYRTYLPTKIQLGTLFIMHRNDCNLRTITENSAESIHKNCFIVALVFVLQKW